MLTFPNAKINIGLQIIQKRADGFHDIASCFYPVGWTDVLEVVEAPTFGFSSSGIAIPGDASTNLCVKAYNLLKADFDLPPVAMYLLKNVPIGAGMGGGSADAAFALKLLNDKFDLKISTENLENYARKLGSDCAFFVQNKPMYCFDKGDQFADIEIDIKGKHLVLVYPNLHISTAEAYAGVKPQKPKTDLREALKLPITDWKNCVENDFETALFEKYPVLPKIKNQLYEQGAGYASMTGSGSTLFGIFESEPTLSNNYGDYAVWKGQI